MASSNTTSPADQKQIAIPPPEAVMVAKRAPARDKQSLKIWLDCFNYLRSSHFVVDSYPDDDSSAPNVDAICVDAGSGKCMAVEHTRIQAFPGEKADNAMFERLLGPLDRHPKLLEPGINTWLSIPVGSISKGLDWQSLQSELLEYLRNHLPSLSIGGHRLEFVSGDFRLPLMVVRQLNRQPGHPGNFLVSRQRPLPSNRDVIAKAFNDKLPKLAAAKADVRILLFEQDSVAGYAPADARQYIDSGEVNSSEMPDEIWWLMTGALESEQYAHSALIHPDNHDERADWKAGTVTSNYPR